MIKTTELMLGNLVEHDGKYHVVEGIGKSYIDVSKGSIMSDFINPIPLTETVRKRLGLYHTSYKNVHSLQIANYIDPIDITPLLSPRYTTHDGVEVWEGDEVWYTFIHPKNSDTPQKWVVGVDMCNTRYLYFNFKEKAQSYIDSKTRKPIFTTEDGVDVFEGDVYIGVFVNGFNQFGHKGKPFYTSQAPNFKIFNYFSKYELAQAYLNKVWAEKEYNDLISKK
jgi:hypothetical protein